MIVDIESNKKLSPIVTKLFLIGKKNLNISLVFVKVPQTIRIKVRHYFIMKIPNKKNFNKQH